MLIKLHGHTAAERLSVFTGHVPEQAGVLPGREPFAQTPSAAASMVSPMPKRRSCLCRKGATSWRPSTRGRNCLQLMLRRRTKGSEATPVGTHLSSACSSRTLDPVWTDPGLAGWAHAACRGDAAENPHFRVSFTAETGCGISRGKLPTNPASTRHNALTNHIDKGQKVKSWVKRQTRE